MPDPAFLIIFVKNPRIGYVKTRLAHTLGDEAALSIYHFLLEKTRLVAQGTRARRLLFYSDYVELNDAWPETDFEKRVQCSGDLGIRMAQAFREAFEAGAEKAGIIGSDCPALSSDVLNAAFGLLENADFVIGPTPDGGYYFLGMRRFEPGLFSGIAWSTDEVFGQTVRQIENLGKRAVLLPVLSDIDTESDWIAFNKSEF